VHTNPGDGSYKIIALYTTSTEYCYQDTVTQHYENSCDKCGCNKNDFGCWWCESLDICCKGCDIEEPVTVCEENEAATTFRIYINDSEYPTYTVNGSAYTAAHEGEMVQFNLIRENGVYNPVGSGK